MTAGNSSVNQATSEFKNSPQLVSSSAPVMMFGEFPASLDMPAAKYPVPSPSPASSEQMIEEPPESPPTPSGEEIPGDILQEILSRLPAKQAVNLRLMCKRWRALISTPQFLDLHLNNWCRNNLTEVLIEKQDKFFSISDTGLSSFCTNMDDEVELSQIIEVEAPGPIFIRRSIMNPSVSSLRIERRLYSFELEPWRKVVVETPNRATSLPIGRFLGQCLSRESDFKVEILGKKSARMLRAFSALGFVVFHDEKISHPSSSCCLILNPFTGERVKLVVDDEDADLGGQVYGLFLHPILRQICVLWGQRERLSPTTIEFKLLNLSSSPKLNPSPSESASPSESSDKAESSCWRNIISRLHSCRPRRHSRGVIPPVIVKDVLYWMVDGEKDYSSGRNDDASCEEAILAFDVRTENFDRFAHPGGCFCPDGDEVRKNHKCMHLLETNNNDGVLSLCEIPSSGEFINIWVRHFGKKQGGGMWIKKHKIRNYLFPSLQSSDHEIYRAFGMVDEELVLVEKEKVGLYVLNLKQRTVHILESKTADEPAEESLGAFMCAYSPSFATLTGGRPREVLVQVPTGVRWLKYRDDVIY